MSEEMSSGADQGKKKKAMMGMIIAIVGFIMIFFTLHLYMAGGMALASLPVILCVVGLIMAIMGMKGSKGMGITGIIVGGIGLIWGGLALTGVAAMGALAEGVENADWEEIGESWGEAMEETMEEVDH